MTTDPRTAADADTPPAEPAAGPVAGARQASTRRFDLAAWLPGPPVLWWIAAAFAIGLLLFALLLMRGRGDEEFFRPGDAPPTAATPRFTPLPAPVDGDDNVSGLGEEPEPLGDDPNRPSLVETAPPPAPGPATPADAAAGAMPVPDTAAPAPTPAMASEPQPIPGQTPAPTYPSASLRRGETGTVIVSATIGVDGRPRRIDVAQSSGSRRLDRAAEDAVRRWRFQPALSDGQPIEANVNIPIEFK